MKKFLLILFAVAFTCLPPAASAASPPPESDPLPKAPAYKNRAELSAEIKRLEAVSDGRSWQEDFTLGVAYMHAGRTSEAVILLEKTVLEQPAFLQAHQSLGMARFKGGDMEGAISAWRSAKADPKAVHLTKKIVVARDRQVLGAKVEALLKDMNAGKKNGWEGHLELSGLYLKLRRPADSLIHINKAIDMKGADLALLDMQGRAHAGGGDYKLAAVSFQKAHDLAPEASPDKRRLFRMLADMEYLLRRTEKMQKNSVK